MGGKEMKHQMFPKRKTVDKMRYPQLEDKNAVSSVDNCG